MSSDILFLVLSTSFYIICFVIFYQKIKSREIKKKIKIKYKGSDNIHHYLVIFCHIMIDVDLISRLCST